MQLIHHKPSMMKKCLPFISLVVLFFSCNEKTKVTTTKFTDVGVKDSIIPALTVASDTIKIDSLKLAIQKNDSILPGLAVGGIEIGESSKTLIEKKGMPDSTDAGMNKVYHEWILTPTLKDADTISTSFKTFSIIAGKDTVSHVKRIRITSPMYKTSKQVKVGSTLAYLKLQYPSLKKPLAKTDLANGDVLEIYDETSEGLAFEIVDNKCVAIIIHKKGEKYFSTSF